MTAASETLDLAAPSQLRPFDMRRDMLAVAELVELCFADTLDLDGQRFIRQMRRAARSASLLGWAAAAAERVSLPLSGFVWEEQGRLVGNLSLIPVIALGRRAYLIANVAVHPEYRRRGIARALTEAALDYLHRRGVGSSWLQVRDDNPTALRLYREAGFVERARRTTWQSLARSSGELNFRSAHVRVGSRRRADWKRQKAWLQRLYPPHVAWHLPLDINLLRPGPFGALARFFSEARFRQWAARREGALLGVLTWQTASSQIDRLWLAAPPAEEAAAIQALLPRALRLLPADRPLALNYPAGQGSEGLLEAGFRPRQTLIWMERQLK